MDAKTRRIVRMLQMDARAMEVDSVDWSRWEIEVDGPAARYYVADMEAMEIGGPER
jgi:hypothetical protein